MTEEETLALLAEDIQATLASRGIHRPIEEIVAALLDDSVPLLTPEQVEAKWQEFKLLVKRH